ncbi:MAG: tetratricopeptide repeat protein [Rickettsiales bacterium]
MSELFREIEEDLKKEKFDKIWRIIWRIAIFGSIIVVLVTGAYVGWDNYRQSKEEANTMKLLQGAERLEIKDYKGASLIFSSLTDDKNSSYYPLAMLQKAWAQEQGDDLSGALKTYQHLANSNSELADFARLKLLKDHEIKIDKNSPFYYTMLENEAWKLLANGKKSEAIDIFVELTKADNVPNSMAARARGVVRLLSPKKLESKDDIQAQIEKMIGAK